MYVDHWFVCCNGCLMYWTNNSNGKHAGICKQLTRATSYCWLVHWRLILFQCFSPSRCNPTSPLRKSRAEFTLYNPIPVISAFAVNIKPASMSDKNFDLRIVVNFLVTTVISKQYCKWILLDYPGKCCYTCMASSPYC